MHMSWTTASIVINGSSVAFSIMVLCLVLGVALMNTRHYVQEMLHRIYVANEYQTFQVPDFIPDTIIESVRKS